MVPGGVAGGVAGDGEGVRGAPRPGRAAWGGAARGTGSGAAPRPPETPSPGAAGSARSGPAAARARGPARALRERRPEPRRAFAASSLAVADSSGVRTESPRHYSVLSLSAASGPVQEWSTYS